MISTISVVREYKTGGWVIKIILCEKEFEGLYEQVKDDLDVHINPTNAQAH